MSTIFLAVSNRGLDFPASHEYKQLGVRSKCFAIFCGPYAQTASWAFFFMSGPFGGGEPLGPLWSTEDTQNTDLVDSFFTKI
jgi:hypothetical protein